MIQNLLFFYLAKAILVCLSEFLTKVTFNKNQIADNMIKPVAPPSIAPTGNLFLLQI